MEKETKRSQELTVVETKSFLQLRPKELIDRASEMATPLAEVIDRKQLFSIINGNKYVRAEGWQILGNMLGVTPREKQVTEHPDGSFEAVVELINVNTGMVIGAGSSLCGIDEKRWAKADRYARRSMAITRATGKAYRLAFAWIMNLAGYEPTPEEEMPREADKVFVEEPTDISYDDKVKEILKLSKKIKDRERRHGAEEITKQSSCDLNRLEKIKLKIESIIKEQE